MLLGGREREKKDIGLGKEMRNSGRDNERKKEREKKREKKREIDIGCSFRWQYDAVIIMCWLRERIKFFCHTMQQNSKWKSLPSHGFILPANDAL